MADRELKGYGTTLFRIEDAVETEVARVMEISPPNRQGEPIDVTHLKSPDAYREFIGPALIDAGEVSLTLIYNPENPTQAQFDADFESREKVAFAIVLPNDDAHRWDFNAFVTGIETPVPMEDKVTQSVTLKISGKPTFAASVAP